MGVNECGRVELWDDFREFERLGCRSILWMGVVDGKVMGSW